MPVASFLSVAKSDAERPDRLINLAYVGAVRLALGTFALGIGLIRVT